MSNGAIPPGDDSLEPEFRMAETEAEANDWGLVLFSAGIPSRVVRVPHGFALQVRRRDLGRADSELQAYFSENAVEAEATDDASSLVEFPGSAPVHGAMVVSLGMLSFYGVTGAARPDASWFAEGSADAALIRAGEFWRAVTALSLHADFAHLISNLLFGTLFLAVLGRNLGPGVAFGLVLLAGAGGNLVNALLRSSDHVSIGASTAVFGAIGILCGFEIVRRWQRGDRWRLVAAPFGAGLAVLAMIGSGAGRVDVFAHLFGLLVGFPLGVAARFALPRPPRGWAQSGIFLISVLAMIRSWQLALG